MGFDEETWRLLICSREQIKSFDKVSAGAFRDLLRKMASVNRSS